jgi:hypothetical protein
MVPTLIQGLPLLDHMHVNKKPEEGAAGRDRKKSKHGPRGFFVFTGPRTQTLTTAILHEISKHTLMTIIKWTTTNFF